MPPSNNAAKKSAKERMAISRAKRSEEQKAKDKESNRVRMAQKRKEMTDSDKERQRLVNRENMAKKRAEKKTSKKVTSTSKVKKDYVKHEREFNRLYKVRVRSGKSEAEHEYEIISNLLCMRRLRRSLTDEEHKEDNIDARERMKQVRERLKRGTIKKRTFREIEEFDVWFNFAWNRDKTFLNLLKAKQPELAKDVEEMIALERKRIADGHRRSMEERANGFWEYDVENDRYQWTGKEPPGDDNPKPTFDDDVDVEIQCFPGEENLTEDEWKEMEARWAKEELEDWNTFNREERNRKARESYQKRKEALQEPVVMPDEPVEMSEYEKIRERIIQDRKEAMAAAGYGL